MKNLFFLFKALDQAKCKGSPKDLKMDWDSVLLWTSCVTLGKSLENLVLKNNRPVIAARTKHQSFWDHRYKPGPAYLPITEETLPGKPFWKM